MTRLVLVFLFLCFPGAASAQHHHASPSPYAGEETRAIKSLSAEDIAELRRGGGWGLAKAAELNGFPGPVHLLALKNQIPLSAGQIAAVEAIFAQMRVAAIAEGERLIASERKLDEAFRARTVTAQRLRGMLAAIAESRSALRHIHLAAHLRTSDLLTEAQITRYNRLRGYGASTDGAESHDPAQHR